MNKKVISLTIFIILGMIILPTIYKIYNQHQRNLVVVVEKELEYQAKRCYNQEVCKNRVVTLKELYEQKYLKEKLVDPKTKKYYSEDSFINLDTLEISLKS